MNRQFNKSQSLCLLFLVLMVPAVSVSQDQISFSNEVLQEIQRYELQLEELESANGPFHASLLEPLGVIAELLTSVNDFEGVAEIQSRQLALMRTTLGFEHPDLVPMVRAIIENQKRLGNWEEISDRLEYLRSLQASIHGIHSVAVLTAIEDQAQWYLTRVTVDGEIRPARNFMKARDLYEELEDVAGDAFGEDSPEFSPWQYKRAHLLAQMISLLNSDDRFAGSILDELIRIDGTLRLEQYTPFDASVADRIWGLGRRVSVLDADRLIGEAYLRDGLGIVGNIQDIAEEANDLEAQAMASLYRGDFRVLLDSSNGSRDYGRAHEQLLQAGISLERIEAVLNRPMPIPLPDFFSKFSELEAYQSSILLQEEDSPEARIHVGVFTAWDEDARSTSKPVSRDPLLHVPLPYHQVDLAFRLSARGKASSIDVLASVPGEKEVGRKAYQALRDIQFRPYIEAGKPKRHRDVQLRYFYFER